MSDIEAQFLKLRPHGGFGLICADPPWSFKNWSDAGQGKGAQAQYNCTPLEWIQQLPVSLLAAPDCMLWLWATNPMLPEGIDTLRAWGFTFKTAGHWSKKTKHGKQAFGTGYVLRCAGEPFLIGTRGKPRIAARNVRSVIEGPIREHSRKPDQAFTEAARLLPDVPKVELFSRQRRAGWSTWGDEAEKFPAPPEPVS